jgi:cytochrome c peroxidase
VRHAFKTPTLRNVAHRGPFMHDGSERSLENVVQFYNRGGDVRRASIALHVKPLDLNQQEVDDLCNFLRTLTGRDPAVEIPTLPNG